MGVVSNMTFTDSLCRYRCTNSLSCLKKLFERETQFRKFEVLFARPRRGRSKNC